MRSRYDMLPNEEDDYLDRQSTPPPVFRGDYCQQCGGRIIKSNLGGKFRQFCERCGWNLHRGNTPAPCAQCGHCKFNPMTEDDPRASAYCEDKHDCGEMDCWGDSNCPFFVQWEKGPHHA